MTTADLLNRIKQWWKRPCSVCGTTTRYGIDHIAVLGEPGRCWLSPCPGYAEKSPIRGQEEQDESRV